MYFLRILDNVRTDRPWVLQFLQKLQFSVISTNRRTFYAHFSSSVLGFRTNPNHSCCSRCLVATDHQYRRTNILLMSLLLADIINSLKSLIETIVVITHGNLSQSIGAYFVTSMATVSIATLFNIALEHFLLIVKERP